MLPRLLHVFILLFLSFIVVESPAQTKDQYTCGDDQLRELLRKVEPAYDFMQLKSNLQIRDFTNQIKQNKNPDFLRRITSDSFFTIPVVVHIIYPAGQPYGTGTNISYAQVRSQVEALNAAFSKNYIAYNGQSHPAYASDTRIRFCLARITSDTAKWSTGPGGTEYGVMRYGTNQGANNHDITASSASQLLRLTHPSSNTFPFDKYLNIWLVSTIGGGNNIMGYAPRPIMPGYLLDGVVMRADVFGDNTTGGAYNLSYGLGQGKVLAHEVGHYLNLYHIFQGGCSGLNPAGATADACDLNGDMICDIEPSTTQNIFCTGSIPNTCTANYVTGTTTDDMINDYMSYADDDCMNTFTSDQVQRMWATLKLQRPGIWHPANLAATGVLGIDGCVPAYLNAQINTVEGVHCAGNNLVSFSNPTAGNTATSYEWQFAGGTPSTSILNKVNVTYAQPGNYTVLLTVKDGVNKRTDSLKISILDCKPDSTMLHMSQWYFGNYGSLDFSSGQPVPTKVALNNQSIQGESAYPGQLSFIAGTISLCDSMGKLLFYSNGVSIWNRNHKKITTSPIFGKSDINASSGFYYIPYPGQKGKYFITGVYPNFDETPSGVRFLLINTNNDSVQPYKEFSHSSLPGRFSQFLTVVPHCNGTDYWIVVKGFGLPDTKFYSFLVTENGIDERQEPVISSGFAHPGFGGGGNQLKANRQGNKLILGSPHGYLDIETGAIYDFDNRTGKVANEQQIKNVSGYSNIQTGVGFSPNGKYFYLFRSSNFATNGKPYWLFQYRVSDLQYNIINTSGFYFAASLQPGPDGHIYVSTQENYVARITNPNQWATVTLSDYLINMRQLDDRIRTGWSIPNFIDARQPSPSYPDFEMAAVNCNTYKFTSLCFDRYTATWNFGDGSPQQTGNTVLHQFTTASTFNVTLTLSSNNIKLGSVTRQVDVLPVNASITGPNNVCTNANYLTQYFGPILKEVNYKWSVTGGSISGPDNVSFVNVSWLPANNKGTITLQVSRQGCTFSDTKTVIISAGPLFSWNLPDSICVFDSSFQLSASPKGGKFTGAGVSNGLFSPMKAGVGNHTLTYTYSDEITCLGQLEKTLKVRRCNIPANQINDCAEMFSTIHVAPNPVKDILRLKSPYVLKFVQVYNALGQKIAEGQMINNSYRLPATGAGLYSIRVYCESDHSYKVFRFLKAGG